MQTILTDQASFNILTSKRNLINKLTITNIVLWALFVFCAIATAFLAISHSFHKNFSFFLESGNSNNEGETTTKVNIHVLVAQILTPIFTVLLILCWMGNIGINSLLFGQLSICQQFQNEKKWLLWAIFIPQLTLTNSLLVREKLKNILDANSNSSTQKNRLTWWMIGFFVVWFIQLFLGFLIYLPAYSAEARLNLNLSFLSFALNSPLPVGHAANGYFFLGLIFAFMDLTIIVLLVISGFILKHLIQTNKTEHKKYQLMFFWTALAIDVIGLIMTISFIVVSFSLEKGDDYLLKTPFFGSSLMALITIATLVTTILLFIRFNKKRLLKN
ncbi:MPN090 family protein [Mycoplasmoides pneumoniae]|uniref:MPN090 family protein n=1 Tax=Mycoplasmoides pneumoniae TaxID=2104 RepID=UPI000310DE3E|nr:hypothetical protein [Mycoplasmoides pneumoniae]BAV19564.1 adhesin P1 homolog [Mycoplasmoides pneumoniae]